MKTINTVRWLMILGLVLLTGVAVSAQENVTPRDVIVYHSARDGNMDIYLYDLEAMEEYRLTTDTAVDRYAEISPDGTQVVFESGRDSGFGLYLLDLASGALTMLPTVDDAYAATWSPLGDRIAYYALAENGVFQIYTYDLFTEEIMRITQDGFNHYLPGWSPDGTAIVTIAVDPDISTSTNVYITDVTTGVSERVSDNPYWDSSVSFSPDGNYILHTFGDFGSDQVYALNIATGEEFMLTETSAQSMDPAWSPDGKYVIFVLERNATAISVMERNGNNVVSLFATSGEVEEPMWGTLTVDLADFYANRDF